MRWPWVTRRRYLRDMAAAKRVAEAMLAEERRCYDDLLCREEGLARMAEPERGLPSIFEPCHCPTPSLAAKLYPFPGVW